MEIHECVYDNGRIGLSAYITLNESSAIEIANFFERLRTDTNVFCIFPKFKKKHIAMMDFSDQKNFTALESILTDMKDGMTEFHTKNAWKRGLIYNICNLFDYKTERILEHTKKVIGCNIYNTRPFQTCGCDEAPAKFHKYHSYNSYDDSVSYSGIPYSKKLGVKVIYDRDSRKNL